MNRIRPPPYGRQGLALKYTQMRKLQSHKSQTLSILRRFNERI